MTKVMDESKDPKPGAATYMNPDADFGTFKPPPDNNNRFNGYTPWTQFSGIPPPANDPSSFTWDTFVTPPPTPSPGADFNVANPNYFTPYNLMHGMGRDSPDYDADPREADSAMLASTPVAQSLIEASLHSPNPLSPPLPDGSMSMNFQDASLEGLEMYAETMRSLGQYQSYNPFGTSDVFNASASPTTPPAPVTVMEEEKTNTDNLRPSYSDVAKTLKTNVTVKEKPEKDSGRKKTNETSVSRSSKSNKKFVPRPIRGRNSISEDLRTTVSPSSKYGLDDFSDVPASKRDKEDSSTGLDAIPPLARKNSTSSVSSGTSGIEEIQLTKSCNNYGNASEDSPAVDKIDPGKDKTKHFDGNINKEENVKPFFDARRIFQSKDTNKRRSQSNSKLSPEEDPGPVLNNGKPSYQAWCTNAAHKKTTHYINNNLRDSQKKTNQNTGVLGCSKEEKDNMLSQPSGRSEKSRTRNVSSSGKSDASTATNDGKTNMPLQTSFDQELIDEWLSFLYDKVKLCMHQLWTLLLMVVLLAFSIAVYLVSGCVHILSWMWRKLWNLLENKIFKGNFFSSQNWRKRVPEVPRKIGLEENIALPSTGDEAMQRLLACKGKDPYSILGLKATASDEDIKKYYRRQAVLVHPDKNQQPGAEEAFKILGHAFDLIGEAGKRQTYDRQLHEASEAEAAMRQFNDLLTKLQDKIQQASNMMRCDNCGGKHKRVPVDRAWYSARFCDRCSIRHSAKEGDVWAETSVLGFLWHYYACMEGKVFDITEWVACKKDFFKHMQANAHHVFYRIATENNRGSGGSGNRHDKSGSGGGEAELEDFISHLFHQAMHTDGNSQSWQQPSQPANGQPWTPPTSQPTTTSTKRNRRKKKKH